MSESSDEKPKVEVVSKFKKKERKGNLRTGNGGEIDR
jgi:hypothetical protein